MMSWIRHAYYILWTADYGLRDVAWFPMLQHSNCHIFCSMVRSWSSMEDQQPNQGLSRLGLRNRLVQLFHVPYLGKFEMLMYHMIDVWLRIVSFALSGNCKLVQGSCEKGQESGN